MQYLTTIIAVLIVLFVLLYIVLPTEKSDLTCPNGPLTKDRSVCRDGNGKSYAGSQPLTTDDATALYNRIRTAATATRRDVCWRRCFIISVLVVALMFLIVVRRVPTACELLGALFVLTMALWVSHSFYNFHHYKWIEQNILNSVDMLETKCGGKC